MLPPNVFSEQVELNLSSFGHGMILFSAAQGFIPGESGVYTCIFPLQLIDIPKLSFTVKISLRVVSYGPNSHSSFIDFRFVCLRFQPVRV
jgi:hypothetical protein